MKKTVDMPFDEAIDYWTGRLTLAIGAGKFRDEVNLMLGTVIRETMEHTQAEAKKAKRGA